MSALDKKYYHNIDLDSNELKAGRIYNVTTSNRATLKTYFLANTPANFKGYIVYDIDLLSLFTWNGTDWTTAAGGSGTVTSVAALTLGTTGTDLSSTVANGTTTPVITLNVPTASATNRGVLSSADWTIFNGKQSALSGTGLVKSTTGTISYITDNSTNWNTAYTDRNKWDGGATGLVAATGRTSLGLGTFAIANYPTWSSGTPFVTMTAAGTFGLNTTTYLTSAVTSVATGTGLTGGTITSTGTISLNTKLAPADSLTGNAGKFLRVNSGETAVEYATASSSGGIPHATASGTDTYTTTITGVTAYTDGDAYLIQFTIGNTDASTLNINSLGAKNLYRNNDGAIIGGDIVAGGEMLCIYDSTITGFRLIGTSPNTLFAYVVNADSVAITRGQPVYAFGSTGNRMSVKLAYNTGDSTSAQTYGLVYSLSIAANQKGIIIIQGVLDELNLGGTWVDGDPVYLGSTAGSLTKTKPYAPNHLVYLGVVERANAGNGIMYVRVQNGYELDELHNVQAQNPNSKDTLYYDNTVSPAQWKTESISFVLGYTPVNKAGDTMTGPLILSGNPTVAYGAATKDYVDTLINGIDWKASVNAATTSALPSYTVGGGGQTLTGTGPLGSIDTVTLTSNQRLLVKNETSTNIPNNGIYVVTQVNPFILTRASDANTSALLAEATVSVAGGSTLSNTQWHCNPASIPITIGTTNITFAQIGSGVYTASSPLSISGNVISIQDALADGTTKGAATFTALDFNATSGVISIDYTNGQAASSSTKGFLTSTDWTTFNNKQNTITGAATTITSSNLTVSKVLVSNSSGKVDVSAVSATELAYVSGVTSNIQTQLNAKLSTISGITAGGDLTGTYANPTIATGAVSLAKMANLATGTIIGNNSGSTGVPLALTSANVTAMLDVFTSTLKGLVPAATSGAHNYLFLAANGTWLKVGTSAIENIPSDTIVANTTGSSASPAAIAISDLTPKLTTLVGDSGSGGTKGLVPAPTSGDASAGKFLKADGTWAVPAGGGGGGGTTTNPLIIKADSGTTEGTDLYTFDGSLAKTINIVAGTNVTISKTTGTLTISSTAGSTPSSYNYIASTHFS